VLDDLASVGVDLDDITKVLEDEGVASFSKSFDDLIGALQTKVDDIKG
jgi:transaldolase/glucose-6-phosphate isomerase